MEDPSEEWEIENENGSSSFEEEKIEKSRMGWILDKSLSLGKKVVITGIVISSAPLVLPPLVVISAIGFAFSVPFGFVYASYACSERLMSKLLPETVPSVSWDDQNLTYEEERGGGGNSSIVKGDFDAVAMGKEETEHEEERVEEAPENASLVKGDSDVVAVEEEEREREEGRIEEEVENASLLKEDVVAMEEEEKEQTEEVQNESIVKKDVVAMEEEEKEQEQDMKKGIEVRIELVEDGSREKGNDDDKVREAIEDDQDKVFSRDEILEQRGYGEGESSERMDDIEIEELDKEKEKEHLLECNVQKPIVGENEEDRKFEGESAESLEFIGDVGCDRENEKNGVRCLKVQPVDHVENGADKNVESRTEEDMSEDKNVAIQEEEDASKTAELNKDVPEMKGREEREKAPPLECNKEPRRISEDRKFEGQNTESYENTGDEVARKDAKNGVHRSEIQPHVSVKNAYDENILSRKQDDLPEDKNENMDKVILATKVREKVKGDQTISMGKSSNVETEGKLDNAVPGMKGTEKLKGGQNIFRGKSSAVETERMVDDDVPEMQESEKVKGGQTISKGKRSVVETEGRGKRKNFKTQKISGNREGPESRRDERHEKSSCKVEKATGETKNTYEKNDLNIVQDPKEKYEETGEETNVEIIEEHNGKDGSNSVPNDITLLEKWDADSNKINLVCKKSTDRENELINDKKDIAQGENSKDGAGFVVYSDPGCEKNEENTISQEVSSNAEAEGGNQISELFILTDHNEAEANEPVVVILPDETKGSGDDVALSRVPVLKHDIDTESKGDGNVCEADGAQSSDEVLLNEEKIWTQIDAVKAIVGYREQRSASIYEEVKALYLFTGVEPPSSSEESSDVAEVYGSLRLLMSVIGVK
ncbi:calponin homology domain-containing protein DDB_G0272472-like isoform X1 [Olea europaea var. sylvestris]|uniref:calponin homology domain-containing protein DDB_G0272472-like isoform X1 n=1 Tax=Olea europaea var. sylvestris TaxID=158386 RepID=UPI000C1D3FF5|nr:calponin homology domain-containing protein DDB_G0272472-like isoform X1 [Olea europaea var. sylvestris]